MNEIYYKTYDNKENHKMDKLNILLIEDSMVDVRLLIEAFKESDTPLNLHVVNSGEDGLDYLFQRGKYIEATIPHLIILDLNLPKISGLTVLEEIKNHEKLKIIPVIVQSASQHDEDILRCYKLHANAYILKPKDFRAFEEMIEVIKNFWFKIVKFPIIN